MSDHEWVEVRVLVPEGWQELVAESLALGPCTSVAFGRSSLASDPLPEGFECVRTFVHVREDTPQLREEIAAVLRQLAQNTGAEELLGLAPEFKELPREDYARSWMKVWKPFRAGRLAVVSPWKESHPRVDDVRLEIEPGAAFGSGRHATTRTCLRVLQERIRPGQRILDAGSGSGILAVAAALFGAREAIGFDIDPNAEPYATKLAAVNGVSARARFLTAGFECVPPLGQFDGLFANIYSDVVQEEIGTLRDVLLPGGWFIFSGCPAHHAEATMQVIRRSGLKLEEQRPRGRWHTFVGSR